MFLHNNFLHVYDQVENSLKYAIIEITKYEGILALECTRDRVRRSSVFNKTDEPCYLMYFNQSELQEVGFIIPQSVSLHMRSDIQYKLHRDSLPCCVLCIYCRNTKYYHQSVTKHYHTHSLRWIWCSIFNLGLFQKYLSLLCFTQMLIHWDLGHNPDHVTLKSVCSQQTPSTH